MFFVLLHLQHLPALFTLFMKITVFLCYCDHFFLYLLYFFWTAFIPLVCFNFCFFLLFLFEMIINLSSPGILFPVPASLRLVFPFIFCQQTKQINSRNLVQRNRGNRISRHKVMQFCPSPLSSFLQCISFSSFYFNALFHLLAGILYSSL